MPEAIVIVDLYRWTEVDDSGVRTTREATRGTRVEVDQAEYDRGISLGALANTADHEAATANVDQLAAQADDLEARARDARAQADAAAAQLTSATPTAVDTGPTPPPPDVPNALTTPSGEPVVPSMEGSTTQDATVPVDTTGTGVAVAAAPDTATAAPAEGTDQASTGTPASTPDQTTTGQTDQSTSPDDEGIGSSAVGAA